MRSVILGLAAAAFSIAQTLPATHKAVLERYEISITSFCNSTDRLQSEVNNQSGEIQYTRSCPGGTSVETSFLVIAPKEIGGGRLVGARDLSFDDVITASARFTGRINYPVARDSSVSLSVPIVDSTAFFSTPKGNCPQATRDNRAFEGTMAFSLSILCDRRQFINTTYTEDGLLKFDLDTYASASPLRRDDQTAQMPFVALEISAVYHIEQVGSDDLAIDHIEIVQPVQNSANEAPLIEGKPAVVRVFVKSVGPGGKTLHGVRGTVTANGKALTPVPGDSVSAQPGFLNLTDRSSSLDFQIPAADAKGSIAVVADVWYETEPGRTGSESVASNNRATLTRSFVASRWPNPTVLAYAPICFSRTECGSLRTAPVREALDSILPTPGARLTPAWMPKIIVDPKAFEDGPAVMLALIREYLNARAFLAFNGFEQPAADQVLFVLPGEGLSGDADLWFGQGGGAGAFWWAQGGNYQAYRFVMHGIGHNVGLGHYGELDDPLDPTPEDHGTGWRASTNQPVSITAGMMQVAQKDRYGDLSSSWVTVNEYKQLHERGLSKLVAVTPKAAGGAAETLVISGWIAADGLSGVLDPGFHADSSVAIAATNSSQSCLRFSGASLAAQDFCFNTLPAAGGRKYFAVAAPYPAGTSRVALRQGDRELASWTTGAAPEVSILSPQAGDVWTGVRRVRWSSNAPNARFNVQYSPDGGTSWIQLASAVAANEYEFDTADIMGGNSVRFRVVASSGIDQATATSAAISIPQTQGLFLSQSTLEFRNLGIGADETKTIGVRNSGTGQALIRLTPPSNPAFTVNAETSFALRPGEVIEIPVTFKPVVAGAAQATLKVNDSVVALAGFGLSQAGPSLSVSPTGNLGHVEVGKTKDYPISITNSGSASLSITAATVTAGFSVVTSVPLTFAAGARADLVLRVATATPGVRTGQLTLSSNDPARAQVNIAVSATGVNGPVPVTSAAAVVNAASFQGGPIAPGEIITIYGTAIGPANLAELKLNSLGRVDTSIGETRVFFDEDPGAMIYALAGQTSVIVPYSVAGKSTTSMTVEVQGRLSDPVLLNVAPTAPGLFSAQSSGTGQGAILNQDYSVNSAANPAPAGSIVLLYGTGEGASDPRVADGFVANGVYPAPYAPVTVTIGGQPAKVLYAGAAPGLVSGLLQINVEIPAGAPAGNQPVVIKAGQNTSQSGLTVAVVRPQ